MMRTPTIVAAALWMAACGAALTGAEDPAPEASAGTAEADPEPAAGTAEADPEPAAGGGIADFTLRDVRGRSHSLSEHLGSKVILLNFWATWCEPCRKEMALLQELFDAHRDRGLMIIAISMDEPETLGEVRTYVNQRRFTYPVLLDTESEVTGRFNPRRAAPFNMIIDRRQRIRWTHEGYVPGDEKKLEQAVLDALATDGQPKP